MELIEAHALGAPSIQLCDNYQCESMNSYKFMKMKFALQICYLPEFRAKILEEPICVNASA